MEILCTLEQKYPYFESGARKQQRVGGLFLVFELPHDYPAEMRVRDAAMGMIQRLFSKGQLVLNHGHNLFV